MLSSPSITHSGWRQSRATWHFRHQDVRIRETDGAVSPTLLVLGSQPSAAEGCMGHWGGEVGTQARVGPISSPGRFSP